VRRIQDGGAAQVNIDQWLQYNSESGPLLKRSEFLSALRNYKVRITDGNNTLKEVPLYQDYRDILGRINHAEDIEDELPEFTRASRSSNDSSSTDLSMVVASLTQLAEIHALLKSDAPFMLQATPYSSAYGDHPGNSPQTDARITAKLEQLRNEIELAVIQRMLPAVVIPKTDDRNAIIRALQKQFTDARNYEALLTLGRIVMSFTPKRPFLALPEMIALQHYTDGIRQQEQLGNYRIATIHFHRAAAARSTIIPVEHLKKLLHTLKNDHPEDYANGTEDFVRSYHLGSSMLDSAYANSSIPNPLPALVVPAR
jgi:hypothetical protein